MSTQGTPGPAPVLDPHAAASGEPLEDYTWLPALQPYLRPGPRLPWDGWLLMAEALRRPVKPGPFQRTRSAHAQVLIEHEVLGDDGRPTATGRPIAEVMGQVEVRLRVDAWTAGHAHRPS